MATILFVVAALLQYAAATVVYKYEGQAVIGIPESGRDGNVLRIEFNVAASRIGDTQDYIAQVDVATVKVHNFTGQLFPVPEGIMSTDGMTDPLVAASKSNLAAQLGKPIVVTRDANGTLSNLRHDPTDLYWSVNLKRGALSLLQINIQTDNGVYTVQESDVTGACPSTYLVQTREHYHGHDHTTPTFLNVTKSRDYSKCTNRTILRHSFFSGVGLSDEEFAEKNIISNAKFAYNISGTKAGGGPFLIESATSEAQHIFSIFKPLSGSLTVYTHQRVQLLSKDTNPGTMPANLMACSWAMVLPNVNTASNSMKFNNDVVLGEVRQAASMLFNPNTEDYMRGIYVHRIIERMRGASLDAWESVGQTALQAGQEHTKLLLDLAPSAGTLESLQKFKAVLDRLTPNITAQYFAINSLLAEPTYPMIATMREICESQQVRETLRETKACVLSLASMVYNRYYRGGYHLKNATFPQEEKAGLTSLKNKVDEMYEAAMQTNTSMQILWVKFAGNLGCPMYVDKLRGIAGNESYPIVLRVHAIRAFRRMPPTAHKSIQDFLLPIFTDWHNDVEVRLAAYRAIMMTRPTQATLDLISSALHHEHDEHVRTYVYSHLNVLTQNPLVDDIPLSNQARVTLQGLTSFIPKGLQYSRYYRIFDTYDDDRNAGFTLDLSVVHGARTLLPREVCLWARGVAFGVQANMLHFCLRLQGIQRALHKILRAGGPVFPDFFAQLNLNQIEYEDYHGMWDASFEGSEIQYQEIPPIITQAAGDPEAMQRTLAKLIEILRTPIMKTVALDGTLQVPTLLGIPVQSNNTYVTRVNMSLGQVELVPACKFNPRQPCTFTLRPSGLYRLGSQHALGVDAGPIQSMVLIHGLVSRNRPDNRKWVFSMLRNKQNMTVSFEADLPKTRVTTGHTEVLPFLVTVDRTKPNLADQYYVKEWKAWHANAMPDYTWGFELNSTAKLTGMLFGYNKTYTRCLSFFLLPANKPADPFCGKVVRDFYVTPQPGAPDSFKISFTKTGPAGSPVPAATFRSRSAMHEDDDDEMDGSFEHAMMQDLSKLSSRLRGEIQQVEEMEEHLREDDFDVEAELESESDVDEDDEEVLVRHRRAARKGTRKDRKPSVGLTRKRRPEASDDAGTIMKETIAEQATTNTLTITGYRDAQVQRSIELTMTRSPTADPQKFQRNFDLKIRVGDRPLLMACGKATVQYSRSYISLTPGQQEEGEPFWSYKAKIDYGTDRCEGNDKSLEFHMNFSRSAEQKLATRLFREGSPAGNRMYPVYLCNKEIAQGFYYTWPCRYLFNAVNEAHHVEITVKAEDTKKLTVGSLDFRQWIAMFLLRLRVKHFKNLRSSFVRDLKSDSREIKFVGDRNFHLPKLADFVISTPESTSDFRNVKLTFPPMSLYFPLSVSSMYYLSGFRLPGVCVAHKVSNERAYVSTFDNVAFNITPPTCPDNTELNVLLAADCSAASKFAVYINFQTTTKAFEVRVLTAAHEIIVRPVGKVGIPDLLVDGRKVVEEKYQVVATDGSGGVIAKNRMGLVTAVLDIGVMMTYAPGNALLIGLSPLYSGMTCGLCGDYNGQPLDEFTMADGTLTEDATLYHRSFVSGAQQCS